MTDAPPRVAVFIDWQNAYKTAREAFELEAEPNERGNFSPFKLARLLAAGHDRGKTATLERVEIHRGQPSSSRDRWDSEPTAVKPPHGFGRVARSSCLVFVLCATPPPYAADKTPVEKGIDVQLALAVAETILTSAADIAIIFTHDTDLLPAVEMVARLKGPSRIETASWSSHIFSQRLREVPGVHHHRVSGRVFELVEEPVNYAHASQRK